MKPEALTDVVRKKANTAIQSQPKEDHGGPGSNMEGASQGSTADVLQELKARGGTRRALAFLAEAVRNAAEEVAIAVEGVALAVDTEREGDLAIATRMDPVALAQLLARLQESYERQGPDHPRSPAKPTMARTTAK